MCWCLHWLVLLSREDGKRVDSMLGKKQTAEYPQRWFVRRRGLLSVYRYAYVPFLSEVSHDLRCARFPPGTPSSTFQHSASRSWAWLMRTYPPSWHTINYFALGWLLLAMQLKSTRCVTSGFLQYFPESKSKKYPSTLFLTLWGRISSLWSFEPFLLFCSHSCLESTLTCFTLPVFFCPPSPSLIVGPALISLTCSMSSPHVPSLLGCPVLYISWIGVVDICLFRLIPASFSSDKPLTLFWI